MHDTTRELRQADTPVGAQPQPGDLIVFNEHVGIVESMLPDGRIQTIEGNCGNQVQRQIHAPTDAIGFVHVG